MRNTKHTRNKGLKTLLIVMMSLVVISATGMFNIGVLTAGTGEKTPIGSAALAAATPESFADLAERLKPSVVNIRTTKTITTGRQGTFRSPFGEGSPFDQFFGDEFFRRFFGDIPRREFKQRSLGSGFIISKDGYIFTNNHVVEKADTIIVKVSDEKEYEAKVVGRDKNTDIALLKIEPDNSLPIIRIGDSDKLRVGDWVIAIGNPFGLSQTVTAGIVSAKGRVIGAGPYDDFIQTDASINPGNSGGPLFNMNGEVVGINTAIVAQGQGIGFAIPINMAKAILDDLKEKGKVTRGWLGVSVQDITDEIAEGLKLKEKKGALVADVFEGDPADEAGVKSGDVIIRVNGKDVENTHELLKIIAGIKVGKSVDVVILREGKEKEVRIKIAERPERDKLALRSKTSEHFGMTVQEITPEIAKHLGLPDTNGVIVSEVKEGSAAGATGIRAEDIILQVNKVKIYEMEDYEKEMARAEKAGSVLLLIQRGGSKFFVVIRK